MRSYTLDISPIKINVNSHPFELQKSDGEAYAAVIDYLNYVQEADKTGGSCIQQMIERGCDVVDELLGKGACFTIFGNTPVSLGHVATLCAGIAGDCLRAYRQYLKEEYLEGINETI